jgi:hypothetical protein
VRNTEAHKRSGTIDPRLKRDIFRHHLAQRANELTPGGDMGLVGGTFSPVNANVSRDKETPVRRLPSINPSWFQELAAEFGVTVKQVQTAVEKALAGKPLGKRQLRVVKAMLDDIGAEKAAPENVELTKRQRELARQLRAVSKAGGRHTLEGPPDEAYAESERRPGSGFEEDDYDPAMDGQARALLELNQQAAGDDPDAVEAIAEDNALGKIGDGEAAKRYWGIIERARSEHGQGLQQRPALLHKGGQGAPLPIDHSQAA